MSAKKTIMLVEDDAIIAMASKRQLEQYGYGVFHVNTGEKAVEAIATHTEIDLILMDINLGSGIDGTQAAEIILGKHDIPIVFVSSHTEPDIVEKTEKITSYGYVVKATGITVLDSSIKMAFKLFDANKLIRSSEAKQKALISNVSDVIGIIGADGILKYKSPNIEKWFGWKPEELVGTDGWLTVHPDDLERIQKEFSAILKTDNLSSNVEYRYKCKDGSYKMIELTATNLVNDPTINGILVNYHDITERIKVQEALRESEEKYRLQFLTVASYNSMYEVVMGEDGNPKDFRFVMVNQAYEKYVGKTASDLIGKTLLEVYPETEQYWIEKMVEAVLTGNQLQLEAFSKEMNIYTEVSLYTPQKGYLAMTTANITERKKAEELLRKSEERFQYAMNASNDGLFDWDLEKNSIYYSPRWKEIIGYEDHEIPNDFSVWETTCDTEDVKKLWEMQQKLIAKQMDRFVLEFKMKHKRGHWVDVLCKARAFFDNKGKAIRIVGTHTDITKRKYAEKLLRDREGKYSSILLSMNDAIYSVDANSFALLQTNDAIEKIFGRPKEDFYANPGLFAEMIHPDDSYIISASAKEKFENKSGEWIYRIIRTDGEIRWVSDRSKLVFDENGIASRIDCIFTDITERKLAEDQIKYLLAEKELTLKEVHHRVKNNLSTISSLLSLQAQNMSEPSAISALKDTESRVKSLMVLYEKLYQATDYFNVPIKDYLPDLIDDIISNFPNYELVKVAKHIDDFPLDAKRLQPLGIIINELLTNIMKYAFTGKESGLIIVSAICIGGHVAISVQDDGIGIPQSVSFENSTGFGLQLVHALTGQLEGTIRIERGNGTKVALEFEV